MFQLPRGTRDFTSKEMEKRKFVEEKIRSTFESYGYKEIQTPTFETLELFTAKSGDSIIDELYAFSDKSDRKLTLRPELTAPAIRFYTEKLQMEPKPLKIYYFGNCFRYDRPQKGRYREFWQAGCEIIGADTSEAIAELIAMAYNILKNIGVKNIQLNIGNLNIIALMFKKLGISEKDQKELLPLIDKSEFESVIKFLENIGLSKDSVQEFVSVLQTSEINEIKDFIKDDNIASKEIILLNKIINLLKNSFSISNLNIKLSIVRGLDYYKGVVFEIDAPVLGAEKQLCGGGSYDLVKLFGGKDVSTAGFAIGFDRTLLAMESEEFKFPESGLDVYIIPVDEEIIPKAIEISQKLRSEGLSTDFDLLRRGIGKSLKYASSKNAKKAIIIGPKELEKDSVNIKDMKTGIQKLIKVDNIIKELRTN